MNYFRLYEYMNYINRELSKFRMIYFGVIVLQLIFLILAVFAIAYFNEYFEQNQKLENLFLINGIYIAVALTAPIFIYFNLSSLRKGKSSSLLDQRLKFSENEKELFKRSLPYITYYFLRGIVYSSVSILGVLIIGNTILKNGNNEILYFIIGFFLITLNLVYVILNIPSKTKLISFLENCRVSKEDLDALSD
jgi:hypothetical protein